jgi:uncharacterized membrane protein YeiH
MILEAADYLGIAAFAASGFYVGKRSGLDWLGIYIVAFLTALGGGVVRDVIRGTPPLAFSQSAPILIVLLVTTALLLSRRFAHHDIDSKPLFVLIDAVGMVAFAISGALFGLKAGFNPAGVAILAFTTAVGGGIFRDILINKIPYVLHGGFYGIIALLIGLAVWILDALHLINTLTLLILFGSGITLRMFAWRQNWHLPKG